MFCDSDQKNPSQNLGRGMAVGIERRGFMQVTQMWPFSSPSPTDDKLQVWGNRLFGYKKPSIMISVIISSWPRPHSSKVINTCIILLKEIEKCIPDCQRKEFSMIYTEMVLKHFFLPIIHLQEILKTNISWIQRCFWPASGDDLENTNLLSFFTTGSTVRTCNKHNQPKGWREAESIQLTTVADGSRNEGVFAHTFPIPTFYSSTSSLFLTNVWMLVKDNPIADTLHKWKSY